MEYQFIELVDIPKLQSLMDEFYYRTKVPHGLMDPEGNILAVTGWQDRFSTCRNGLTEGHIPIIVGGKHVATLFLGRYYQTDYKVLPSKVHEFGLNQEYQFNQEHGLNGDVCPGAQARVPVIPKESIESCLFYFARLVELLAEKSLCHRKKTEEALLKTSKLESVSIFTAGIAHDFNNILTILLGNVSLAKALVSSEKEIYQKLVQIENATLQAKDLTLQLLTFAKGGTPQKGIVDIGKILKDSVSFALSGSKVGWEFFIPEDIWLLEIDVGQFTQVIYNLVINAVQAMQDGGIIKIRAKNVSFGETHTLPLTPGNYVEISIADQGIGIPEENLEKIFDPYFTTKSGGSGLGLATSNSILRKQGGYLTIASQTGSGTTCYIYLPACINTALSETEPNRIISPGKGRILVMDDDAQIRQVLGEMLAFLGYDADFAADGEAAIKLYKRAVDLGFPYDALIMDLTIPGGMGGLEAVRRLHEDSMNIKAIVSSGYSEDPVIANFREYGFKGFIAKPYSIEKLSSILQTVVREESPESGVAN